MKISVLKSKIHRAVVTEANVDYIGSISIDECLMQAAKLQEYEKVHVLNVTNGQRLVTYAIKAPKRSGEVCINGAAAHLISMGDLVIIVAYGLINNNEEHAPVVVHVNKKNHIIE